STCSWTAGGTCRRRPLLERIPLGAMRTLALPFEGLTAAGVADEDRTGSGHVSFQYVSDALWTQVGYDARREVSIAGFVNTCSDSTAGNASVCGRRPGGVGEARPEP